MNKRSVFYAKDKYIKTCDIIIFSVVVIALVISLLLIFLPQQGSFVEIYHSGTRIKSIPLSEDTSFSIDGVTVKVQNGKAIISDSDCPDKLCIHSKSINRKGESIICLPNKVIVKISGESEIDGVTQ